MPGTTQFIASPSQGGSLMRGLLDYSRVAKTSRQAVAQFRANGPLTEDAQEAFDDAVIKVKRERLVIVDDLINAGLTFPMPNWLSVLELDWEQESEAGRAHRTMSPGSLNETSTVDRNRKTIPIYATISPYNFNIRFLMASERAGTPIDTTMAEQCTRRVNVAIEDAAWEGLPAAITGNAVEGILNATNRNTWNFTSSRAWDDASHTGENILTDVLAGIAQLEADNMFGPYNLYVPASYDRKLNQDFKSNSDKTIRQRLEELQQINAIRAADRLKDQSSLQGGSDRSDTVVLIQMTSDVVDVVVGQQPTPISWTDGPGWELSNVILSCIVPRVKDTYDNQSGIAIGTPS